MRLSVKAAILGGLVAAFMAGSFIQKYGVLRLGGTTYVKTLEPLLLNAGGEHKYHYMLPPNTPMYKDFAFPEGHTRYVVYVNVKDRFASESVESEKTDLIDPVWAYTIAKDEVPKLMTSTPISKGDLIRILKAREVTREDLAKIAREWSE